MKGECIEYLLSALNSSVSEWLFSKVGTTTGVGTIRWKKYTIEQLIVAKLSTEQLNTHLAAFNDLKVGKMSITDFECLCIMFINLPHMKFNILKTSKLSK